MIGAGARPAQICPMVSPGPCTEELWLRLLSIHGVGPATVSELLGRYSGIEKFARAVAEGHRISLRQADLIVQQFSSPAITRLANKRLAAYRRAGCELLFLGDERYPHLLAGITNPPPLLGVRGTLPLSDCAVAMVGSRKPSNLGITVAREWSELLAASGVTIVSGLAHGIDRACHEGALAAGGATVAVLGCGPDTLYPPEHAGLAERITSSGGAIVSQFWPGTAPGRGLFPARNRVIAGLAAAVVVVEAGPKSGSLYTARYAMREDRPVFAVPGPVRGQQNKGSNGLLLNGATSANEVSQVTEVLDIDVRAPVAGLVSPAGDDGMMFDRIDLQGRHVDDLTRELDWVPSRVLRSLLALQLRGMILQLPGNRFARTR